MGGKTFATRNRLNKRMDLAIDRKADYHPVGYIAMPKEEKSIKQTPSNKVRVISKRSRGGDWQQSWFARCYKAYSIWESFTICYSSGAVTLAVKRSLGRHSKNRK